MTFACTKSGYVNLDHVRRACHRKDGLMLVRDDDQVETGYGDLHDTIIQLIPTGEPYEVLIICCDADGSNGEVYSDPVICWALTADGQVMPITPGLEVPPAGNRWALRRRGHPEVFGGQWQGNFLDQAEWLKEYEAEQQRTAQRQKEKQDAGI